MFEKLYVLVKVVCILEFSCIVGLPNMEGENIIFLQLDAKTECEDILNNLTPSMRSL